MKETGDDRILRLHPVVEINPDRCTVRLTGELDVLTGPLLLQVLDMVPGEARHISLDMTQLSFCDVAGLRAVVTVQRAAHERGVGLTVCNTAPHLSWLLRVTGTSEQLLGEDTDGDQAADAAGDPRQWSPDVMGEAPPPAPPVSAGPRTAEAGSERDAHAGDWELLDQERGRLLDERAVRVGEHQRWEDIREDLADLRERELERREGTETLPRQGDPPRR
jgi:anti-anti-sigma factor